MGGWAPVFASLPYILIGLALISISGHTLNVLQFGDEQAQQLGLRVTLFRTIIILAATMATAAAVAFTGIIGFVGLVVPQALRLLGVQRIRDLAWMSAVGGATLLTLADLVARTVVAPLELPVGAVMALVGAPLFIVVLTRGTR